MDNVAKLRAKDRGDIFRVSAAKRKLAAAIIEKDFWVCWTLRRLFTYGRTVPFCAASRVVELQRDYRNMQEMFFTPPPTFETLLDLLRVIETEANR